MSEHDSTFADHLAIPPALERRAFHRHECWLQADCCLPTRPRGSSWPVTVRDLGTGGLGIVAPQRLEPGTVLSLKLSNLTGEITFFPIARVKHIQDLPDDTWYAGCAFAQSLTPEQLELLL